VSYKLDDHHAFGFGVSAQYMKAYLSKAVDLTGVPTANGDGHAAFVQMAGVSVSIWATCTS
jgi:long-chain fatty acid transport protein